MQLFMIACHVDISNNIIGFRITDTDTGEVKDYNYTSVKAVLAQGHKINGIELDENNNIKGSNGYLKRYTQLINGITIGKCPVVIVKEYPNNVYDVSDHMGRINTMSEEEIIKFAEVEGIANGKIVSNYNKKHISSICGEYPKDKSFDNSKYGDKLKAKMKVLNNTQFNLNENNFAYTSNKNIANLVIGKGCLGIADYGFSNCQSLFSVKLPNTCTYLGEAAFENCTSLESINIPEGVVNIPKKCFSKCTSLKEIVLPNSLRTIEVRAFAYCTSLKKVSIGRIRPDIAFGAFTNSTRYIVRQ